MIEFVKDYDNAFVAPFAYETIWGSTYLYKTYLHTIKHLLGVGDWDFFINLSEASKVVNMKESAHAQEQTKESECAAEGWLIGAF